MFQDAQGILKLTVIDWACDFKETYNSKNDYFSLPDWATFWVPLHKNVDNKICRKYDHCFKHGLVH